jgi:hypothetical protein
MLVIFSRKFGEGQAERAKLNVVAQETLQIQSNVYPLSKTMPWERKPVM